MSDAQNAGHSAEQDAHEGPIKTPKQLIAAVVASFVVPVVVIIMLTNFVNFGSKDGAGSDGMGSEAVAKRLQPVGSIEIKDASDTGALKTGEQVFQAQCSACHAGGVSGAPKFGDKAAWAPRLALGFVGLVKSAAAGKNAMPPKGGAADLTDEDKEEYKTNPDEFTYNFIERVVDNIWVDLPKPDRKSVV